MAKNNKVYRKCTLKINDVQPTSEKLTGRARLAFFVAYLHSIQIIVQMAKLLNSDLALRTRFSLLEKKRGSGYEKYV